MKLALTLVVGVATLLGDAIAIHSHPNVLCKNSTPVNQTQPLHTTVCTNITASATTSTSLDTIYTSSPNSSVPPPSMYISFFTASVDRYTRQSK